MSEPGFPAVLVDRYLVRQELGRGATATVYRAHDSALGREVAVKLLHARDLDDAHALERFRREGEVLGGLDHPGIVRVLDAGSWQGCPYLVFELVEGGRTLRQAFLGRPLRERVALVRDVAAALAHAHGRGVIHRDVKPDNVLVDREGRARLSDFGLASAIGLTRMTASGTALGTPVAMAPEQVQGDHRAWGPPTDVWALGVILYEALTGELPFFADTMVQLGHLILETEPRPPRSFAPVPPELEELCQRCLRKEPARRPQDAGVVLGELEAWLQRGREGAPVGLRRRERLVRWVLGGGWALTALVALVGWTRSTSAPAAPAPVAALGDGGFAAAAPQAPDETGRRLARARARVERGDHRGALADLDEVLRRSPGHPEALLLRARALWGTGDTGGARSDLQVLLSRDPGLAPAHRTLAALAAGKGEWAEAERHLSRALELEPGDPALWAQRAMFRLEQGSPAALEDARQAIELDPRYLPGQLCAGQALLQQKQLDAAEGCFRQMLEVAPEDADAVRFLGRVCQLRGDFTGALEAYRRAEALLPAGDPRAGTLRRWVELARVGQTGSTGR